MSGMPTPEEIAAEFVRSTPNRVRLAALIRQYADEQQAAADFKRGVAPPAITSLAYDYARQRAAEQA